MKTNTFSRPLLPGFVDQQCDRNAFCYRVFPVAVHENGESVLQDLQCSPRSAYDFFSWAFSTTNAFYEVDGGHDTLLLSDIEVTKTLLLGSTLLTITLSPPRQSIGVYLIGLLIQGATIRHLTLENEYGGSTRLCEWVNGSQYLTLGVGSSPTVEAFHVRLEQYLTLGF